jgi:hypothetical protein
MIGGRRPYDEPLDIGERQRPPARHAADDSATELTPLLRLQRSAGNRAVGELVAQRHKVAGTDVHRHIRAELFDPPGTSLDSFERSIQEQADWFAEPSLTAPDREDLHFLLRRTTAGPQVLAGVGDLPLADLRGVPGGAWAALDAFGRGCIPRGGTVRIRNRAAYPLDRRVALGRTLIDLEAVIPAAVLEVTVSEQQLVDVEAGGLVPKIADYWNQFHPHLQGHYQPGAGARAQEFQHILDLLTAPGIAPFAPLLGRVRNLHRFSVPTLQRLVTNFADTSRRKRLDLVLHTGHDADAFQAATSRAAMEDLVTGSPNLVLMLEGRDTLDQMTAQVQALTLTHGKLGPGFWPRLGQVMIAGHGENRSIEMAGTGAPVVDAQGNVGYPAAAAESLDLDRNQAKTMRLLSTLVANLDPATARIVFEGCLVGSNVVPLNMAAGAVAAHIAANPSLGTVTRDLMAARGLRREDVFAARASTASGDKLRDVRTGNLSPDLTFDPDVYGEALTYVATGTEPTGLMRAAVEVAATDPIVAERQLRIRLGRPAAHGWWGECTLAMVRVALDGVAPGTAVDMNRLNALAHLADFPFLVMFQRGVQVGHFTAEVNPSPWAGRVYAELAATPTFQHPGDLDSMAGRLVIEQGWLVFGAPREVPLIAYLDATAALTTEAIERHLATGALGPFSAGLFPAAAAPTVGRLRLALAWLATDVNNPDVRAFVDAQVVVPAGGAQLSPAAKAQLGSVDENAVLELLGRRAPVVPPAGPGGVALPGANAQVRAGHGNEVLVVPHPYDASVIPGAVNIRTLPGLHGKPFAVAHAGDILHVAGFTHDWAAVDRNGRLGFIHRTLVTPP